MAETRDTYHISLPRRRRRRRSTRRSGLRCVSREPPGVSARHIRTRLRTRSRSALVTSLVVCERVSSPFLPPPSSSSSSWSSSSRSRRGPAPLPRFTQGATHPLLPRTALSRRAALPRFPRAHTPRIYHTPAKPTPPPLSLSLWCGICIAAERFFLFFFFFFLVTHDGEGTRDTTGSPAPQTTRHDRHTTTTTEDVGKTERARGRARSTTAPFHSSFT